MRVKIWGSIFKVMILIKRIHKDRLWIIIFLLMNPIAITMILLEPSIIEVIIRKRSYQSNVFYLRDFYDNALGEGDLFIIFCDCIKFSV